LISILTGCGSSTPSETAPILSSDTVAAYGDISVTVDELDAFVIALPPKDRPHPGQDLDAWFKDQINEIILERTFLKLARENHLDEDPIYVISRREAARRVAILQFFHAKQTDWEKIDLETVKQAYESRKETLVTPEKRTVYHLFRRAPDKTSKAQAVEELTAIRDRVLHGENFSNLAQQLSDSESRHQEGNIGWIQRGMLQDTLEDAIFSLEEGVPSQPVTAAEGVHLFYVDSIIPEKALTFSEVRKDLTEHLLQQRRMTAIDEVSKEVSLPQGVTIVDRDSFLEIGGAEDKSTVIFQWDDTTITMEEFLRNVAVYAPGFSSKSGPVQAPIERAWQAFNTFRKSALVEYYCKVNGLLDETRLQQDLANWERKGLVAEQRRLLLIDLASKKESKLNLFYQSNIGRFGKPTRVHLEVLKIPLDHNADKTMARLEAFANSDDASLDSLADLGGTREDLGWKPMSALKRIQPKLPSLVSSREPGQVTPPYRGAKSIQIAKIIAREDAEPIPFEEARQQVTLAYVEQYKAQLYQDLVAKYIDPDKLTINPEGLKLARQRGSIDQQDISAEKLEEMFESLEK